MILRRIADALKRQDWTQVIIELMIVVVGIYLGFQLTEWGTEREDRVAEAEYLSRFHDEVYIAQQSAQDAFQLNILRYNAMSEITKIVSGENDADSLTQFQCHNLFGSHINAAQIAVFPTLVELNSSGKMDLIQNTEIKNAMINYEIDHDLWSTQEQRGHSGLYNLPENFPELIQVDMTMTILPQSVEAIDQYNHTCDLELMKENPAFRNHLVDNTILRGLFVFVFGQYQERLQSIHELLDAELGINHAEDGS